MLQNLLLFGASAGTGTGTSSKSTVWYLVIMVAFFGIMYFIMIRPQKKKQKEEQSMRDNIQIGDELTTIGGIMGRVVTVKEDSLIIETGADRNKMKVTRWAVQTNNSAEERANAEKEAAKAAQEADKKAKAGEGKKERRTRRSKNEDASEDKTSKED